MKIPAFAFIAASLFSTLAFGEIESRETAIDAFTQSEKVAAAIEEASNNFQFGDVAKDAKPQAVLVGGSCGFAGCDESYLVVQTLSTLGANTQTFSVAALVNVHAVGGTEVRIAEINAE